MCFSFWNDFCSHFYTFYKEQMMRVEMLSLNAQAETKKQSSLYDTPLRELFEEARKKAQEQYKVQNAKIQGTKQDKDDENAVLSANDDDLIGENVKIKEILREKIKEQNKENIAQSLANAPTNDKTQGANSRANDELAKFLSMMI